MQTHFEPLVTLLKSIPDMSVSKEQLLSILSHTFDHTEQLVRDYSCDCEEISIKPDPYLIDCLYDVNEDIEGLCTALEKNDFSQKCIALLIASLETAMFSFESV